jgi:hypothetical protein
MRHCQHLAAALVVVAAALCPAEQIAATAAWRAYPGSGESLDVVELILGLVEELGAEAGGSA